MRRPTPRTPVHVALLFVAGLGAAWFTFHPHDALGQMGHTGNGTVEIRSETERQLFWSLICTCGCPRETLGTCPCDIATARRNTLRGMLEEGKSVEQIQDAYAAEYGIKSLAVPRNKGANRALYAVPIVLILAGGLFAVMVLKKWSRKGAELAVARGQEGVQDKPAARDKYDDRLDDELKELDDE